MINARSDSELPKLQPGAAAQLAAASMIEADAAIRANISNTLMAMSADPTQDPGVVLRLYKCAAPPSSRARSAVAARRPPRPPPAWLEPLTWIKHPQYYSWTPQRRAARSSSEPLSSATDLKRERGARGGHS